MAKDKLTGADYFERSYLELQGHSDFDPQVYGLVRDISSMTTDKLKTINLEESNA